MPPRAFPFGFSLALHGAVLAWVAAGPVRRAAEEVPTAYDMAIRPYEDRIVWYNLRDKLPEISPLERHGPSLPPQAENQAPQSIAATPPRAPRSPQLVWLPAPPALLKTEFRSPNLLAFHAPAARPAPPPRPRIFAPPPEAPPAPRPAPLLPAPPELRAAAELKAPPVQPARPEPRAFRPPEPERRASAPAPAPALALPPQVAVNRDPRLVLPVASGAATKAVPRAFQPPAGPARQFAPAPAATAPPQLAATLGAPPAALAPDLAAPARPQPRAFRPPSAATGPAGSGREGAPRIDAPALALSSAPPGRLSMAIVGLNPAERLEGPPPEGSREARFSAGPVPRPTGSQGEPVESARIFVPGLMTRNAPPARDPVLIARAAPTSPENLRRILRAAPPVNTPDLQRGGPPEAPPGAPLEPMLAGRAVYSMAVQMPNITSYSGSWLIWFAERGQPPGARAGIQPPVPVHKVDPKYVASAMDDRVEGKVRLAAVIRADGTVDSVVVLAHLDDRLDAAAREALSKWRFEPALRDGRPVEVDAVVEIPFRLAPRETR